VASFVGESNLIPARILALQGDHARIATSLGEFRALLPQERRWKDRQEENGVLLFRPEACRITNPTEDPPLQNTPLISGIVDGIEYLGSGTVITLQSGNGQAIKAKLAGASDLSPGDRITVKIDPEACILLP
jgi:ABC-type Fe3+/spermidine/putrescine transport system ATPase subunit